MKKSKNCIGDQSISNKIKNLQKNLNIDYDLSSRITLWSLVEKISLSLNSPLKFSEGDMDTFTKNVHNDEINIQTIIDNPDLFDSIFEAYIPKNSRKIHGQFLTPKLIAQFMVKWGISYKPEKVLDPAVGPGIFLSEILKENGNLKELLGFDIDNLMLNIANTRLNIINNSDKVKLIHHDFLTYKNNKEKFDFIICNPPYLKFHSFDRNKLIKGIESEINKKLSRLTNIYSLFFMHSEFFLNDNGIMAFITPSEYLYTGYGIELKNYLLSNFTIVAIILVDLDKLVFNDVLSSAAVTLLQKRKAADTHIVKLIKVKKWDNNEAIFDALNYSKSSSSISVVEMFQNKMDPSEKWLTFFDKDEIRNKNGLVPLNSIACAKRGIATGHNEFFTLSIEEINNLGIESSFLIPVISKTKQCNGYIFSKDDFERLKLKKEKMFLLYCFSEPSSKLKKYIEMGERENVNQRYLTKSRDPWYSMERRPVAPILATVFSRDRMRFIYNEAQVSHLTAFHGIYPAFTDISKIKAFLAYLNSPFCKNLMELQKRTYGGGLDKYEPRDLERIMVVDIEKLSSEDVHNLSSLFDNLCEVKSDVDEIAVKNKIDHQINIILNKINNASNKNSNQDQKSLSNWSY